MDTPMFSFVVPVYNTEKYLKRCLDSVFAQTCKDFEVIVVDDCSPGNCKEIVDSYGEKIRYVRHDKNRSLLQARITGGKLAKGEYLVSLDSDDYVGSELISELKREALANHSDVIVYHMGIETSGKVVPAWHNHSKDMISSGEMLRKLYAHEVFWPMCGKAVLREVYIKAIQWTGIDDELYINSTEDLGNMVSVLINSSTVSFIEYLGYFYWQNPDSMTKDMGCFSRILPRATQNKLCIDMLLTAAEKHRCVSMVNVKELAGPSIRWFVEEIEHLSPAEWSRCVNMLCGIYGCDIVLEVAKKYCRDFFERYIPDKSLFFHEQRVTVRNLAVICFRRNGGGAERATGIWMQKVQKLGIKCIWMPDRTWEKDSEFALDEDPVKREAELARYIKSEKIDAVLLVDHWRYTCFQDLLTAKRLGCKTIIAEHSTYFFPLDDLNPSLFVAREHFYPIADVITVLSPENVAWWKAAGFDNVVYMPNFLTFDAPEKLDVDYGEKLSRLEFVCVGRICRRKNAFAVLQAFKCFIDSYPEFADRCHLSIIGRYEGDRDRIQIESAIEKFSFAKCVTVTGEVSDIAPYYKKATLHLMASRLEGAPMVIMEAKSYGVPTVMFELPYVDGAVEEEGVVSVKHGDVSAMAKAMYDCIVDQSRYENLSRSAVRSLKRFSSNNISSRWDKVFRMLESGGEVDPMCEPVEPARMLPMTMGCISRLAPVLHGWWVDNVNKVWNSAQDADAARRLCADAIKEWNFWESEFIRIENCRSYKLGRMVTWPMRMARNSYLVLREYGFAEFCRRIPRKICNLKKRFIPVTK